MEKEIVSQLSKTDNMQVNKQAYEITSRVMTAMERVIIIDHVWLWGWGWGCFSSSSHSELAAGLDISGREGKEAQRQVQKHSMLKARSGKIRIPPDLGDWALSMKGELS